MAGESVRAVDTEGLFNALHYGDAEGVGAGEREVEEDSLAAPACGRQARDDGCVGISGRRRATTKRERRSGEFRDFR